jgi:tetratricopeptide (TPR) repeat protein
VLLWDLHKHQERAALQVHGGSVMSVVFSPDGKTLAAGTQFNLVKLWDTTSGKEMLSLSQEREWSSSVVSLGFSPNGRTLATGSNRGTVRLWDAGTGKLLASLKGDTAGINSIAFHQDGKTLATAGVDWTVRLWDVDSGQERIALKGHKAEIFSMAFSPDGSTLATGSGDGIVKLWRAATDKQARAKRTELDEDDVGNREDDRFHLAVNRDTVGEFLGQTGRLDEAAQARREAQKIWTELVAESNHEDRRAHLAWNHESLADIDRQAGRSAESAAGYRRAIEVWEKLAVDFPRQPQYAANRSDRLLLLGHVLRRLARHEEAEQAYRQGLEIGQHVAAEPPTDVWRAHLPAAARYHLGDLLLETNRFEPAGEAYTLAIENYERLMQDFPDYTILPGEFLHVVISLATVHFREHHPDRLGPLFERASNDLARQAGEVPNIPEYQTALKQLPLQYNNFAWQLATSANVGLQDGPRAVELARKAIELAPGEPTFWNTLGTSLYRAGDSKAAIEVLQTADELFQGRVFGHDAFFIAMAHWQLDDADAARKWYLAAARWMEKFAPKNEELIRFRAEAAALLDISETETGARESTLDDRQLLKLVHDAWPDAAWPWMTRGRTHQALEKPDDAEADFRRALDAYTRRVELQPEFWALWAQRASASAELGEWEYAGRDFEKAVELNAAPAVWYQLAIARLGANDRAGYRQICARIVERFVKAENVADADLLVWGCALAPESVVDYTELLGWAERLVAAHPKNFTRLNAHGAILYRAGRFQEALDRLNEARAAYGADDEQRTTMAYNDHFLAKTHHRLGHAGQARDLLKQAIGRTDQDRPDKSDARRRAIAPWNRRLTLELLRSEAQSLIEEGSIPRNGK